MIGAADSFLTSSFMDKAVISREQYARLRDELRQKEFTAGQEDLKKKKDEEAKRADKDEDALMDMMIVATAAQIETFTARLDLYDTASVEALLANEKELREVTDRIDVSLSQATQLADGRRVFKSEDGTRVFDETGVEVSPDEISADEIPDSKRRFEPFWKDVQTATGLTEERQNLHDFQNQLDNAREKAGENGITAKELEDLSADIDAAAPERVRKLVGDKLDLAPTKAGPEQVVTATDDLDIPATPKRTSPIPAGP